MYICSTLLDSVTNLENTSPEYRPLHLLLGDAVPGNVETFFVMCACTIFFNRLFPESILPHRNLRQLHFISVDEFISSHGRDNYNVNWD